MQTADLPPNQTIYLSNLYEKLNKEELRKSLYTIFSQFGKILDVVVLKTKTLRGQAWVVFADIPSATNAMRTMQGFTFFEKPMKISYAKGKSDAVAKVDGTFKTDKKKRKQAPKAEQSRPEKRANTAQAGPATQQPIAAADKQAAPSKTLFLSGLPEDTQASMLHMLFSRYPGCLEARVVEQQPGLAFVDFDSEKAASDAMDSMQGFQVTQNRPMQISFAKK